MHKNSSSKRYIVIKKRYIANKPYGKYFVYFERERSKRERIVRVIYILQRL